MVTFDPAARRQERLEFNEGDVGLAGGIQASEHLGGFHSHGCTPIAGWLIRESPIKIT